MILMRCDANAQLGFGHLARCRVLAEALVDQGQDCILIGPDEDLAEAADAARFAEWMPAAWEPGPAEADRLAEIAARHGAGVCVIDDYRADAGFQQALAQQGLRWLQFEVRYDRPLWADIVVNANPVACAELYGDQLRRSATRLLLGPSYAMLRPGFAAARHEARTGDSATAALPTIFVCFGGGDDRGAIELTLEALLDPARLPRQVVVVSGRRNPHLADIRSRLAEHSESRVSIEIEPANLPQLMAPATLAITSGGTLTYELACLGVPMLIVAISEDQMRSVAWQQRGCAEFLGPLAALAPGDLRARVEALLEDAEARTTMSEQAVALVDGGGARRVAEAVCSLS